MREAGGEFGAGSRGISGELLDEFPVGRERGQGEDSLGSAVDVGNARDAPGRVEPPRGVRGFPAEFGCEVFEQPRLHA